MTLTIEQAADLVISGPGTVREKIIAGIEAYLQSTEQSFQSRVEPWMLECFGAAIAADTEERNHRFLEESLELVQSLGCTRGEVQQLVDYVYGRPVGYPPQEVGGVMVTLAALCLANNLNMHANGETELARIWTKVEEIRAKQAAKPKHSLLPEYPPATPDKVAVLVDALEELIVLMESTREGNYKPDSFTCQPARSALASVQGGE